MPIVGETILIIYSLVSEEIKSLLFNCWVPKTKKETDIRIINRHPKISFLDFLNIKIAGVKKKVIQFMLNP